jgi:site-specific DNA-methyltransferase (adenine-specific)
MLDFGFYNMDCMEGMKEFPDKFFELAIVDPPYGIGDKKLTGGGTWAAKYKAGIVRGT